jgi:lactoylglutathione lyase
MVCFFLRELADPSRELECLREVGEAEHALQSLDPVDLDQLPVRNLWLELGDLLVGHGRRVSAAGNARLGGQPHGLLTLAGTRPGQRELGQMGTVRELRLVLTVDDFDAALALYRDALGLEERYAWEAEDGRVVILEAGVATLELADAAQAAKIDELEVGSRVAGQVRIALEVADSEEAAKKLVEEGAELVAGPVVTPWRHRNVRLLAPDGMQLTLFTPLDERPEDRIS